MLPFPRAPLLLSLVLLLLLVAPPRPGTADTIEPGQRRVVEGVLSAVDQAYRSVVVEVPLGNKELTVGVTMAKDAEILQEGRNAALTEFEIGNRVTLEYERRGGRLVGLRLQKR